MLCCCGCSKEIIDPKDVQIDHIQPLCEGGTNDIFNLQILCVECHFEKTKEEQETGYVNVSDTESSFNSTTLDIVQSNLYRSAPEVNVYAKPTVKMTENDVFVFDINGCYKNSIYYNTKYNYPLFTVMDDPKPYKIGKTRPTGIYYVETEQNRLIRGNGWYHNPTIDYLLAEHLIKEENIKYYIKANARIPYDYFNEFIDDVVSTFKGIATSDDFTDPDSKIEKMIINVMIGCLKPRDNEKWKSHCIVQDRNEAYYRYLEYKTAFVDVKQVDDESYYHVMEKYKITKTESEMPIWNKS